jgi:hypothetical protein
MVKAGRRTLITPRIKDLIFQILQKNPDATVARIHGDLERLLIEKEIENIEREKVTALTELSRREENEIIKTLEFKLYSSKYNLLPTTSTLNKYLQFSKIRDRITSLRTNPEGLDIQWNIGVNESPRKIPAGDIPLLLEYKKRSILQSSEKEIDNSHSLTQLTVRKAKWLVYLQPIVNKWIQKYDPGEDGTQALFLLSAVANLYMLNEQRSQLLENDVFDSTELDKMLFETEHSTYQNFMTAIAEANVKTSVAHNESQNEPYVSELIAKVRKKHNENFMNAVNRERANS